MKKSNPLNSTEEITNILMNEKYGILSTVSADGQPYGVALNYCYISEENSIFFHCGKNGKKLENINTNSKVSFIVVGHNEVIPEKFTTHYKSVIVTGIANIVLNKEEIVSKLQILCDKFSLSSFEKRDGIINKYINAVNIYEINIVDISFKCNNN